ncbi:MAG: ATP-binding cassette domain-containing protein [Pseudomonadota bacterium]
MRVIEVIVRLLFKPPAQGWLEAHQQDPTSMQTLKQISRQVRAAIITACVFSGCIASLLLVLPLIALTLFNDMLPTANFEGVLMLGVMALGGLITLAVLELVRARIMLRTAVWFDHVVGHVVFRTAQYELTAARHPQAALMDADALRTARTFMTSPAMTALFDAVWVPLFLLAMVALYLPIGLFAGALAVIMVVAIAWQRRGLRKAQQQAREAAARVDLFAASATAPGPAVPALKLAAGTAARWEKLNRAHVSAGYTYGSRVNAQATFAAALWFLGEGAVLVVGGLLCVQGALSPALLVALLLLTNRALGPLRRLALALPQIQAATHAKRVLRGVLVTPARHTAALTPAGSDRLVLNEVGVTHPGRAAPSLRGVSLDVAPGEVIVITGPSGAGKSSLTQIMAGALAPTYGTASWGGQPLASLAYGEGPPPIGYAPDEPVLIDGTIYDNIVRFSDMSLLSAARAAMQVGAHEFITALPRGYETPVGPNGVWLSLRERRAVSLCRAFHGNPRLIVLDSPDLGLSNDEVERLADALSTLAAEGTGLAIASRHPALHALADRIVVLDEGRARTIEPGADEAPGEAAVVAAVGADGAMGATGMGAIGSGATGTGIAGMGATGMTAGAAAAGAGAGGSLIDALGDHAWAGGQAVAGAGAYETPAPPGGTPEPADPALSPAPAPAHAETQDASALPDASVASFDPDAVEQEADRLWDAETGRAVRFDDQMGSVKEQTG